MALYGQPNAWTCGPFALKHALLALGVFAREEELARAAGTTERLGTDEPGLRRAARLHGAELRLVRGTAREPTREALDSWLSGGAPVLLCIDQWEHWVTAVSADAEIVMVFDSKYDAPLRAEPWEELLDRLACRRPWLGGVWTRTLYDLHPILPRREPRLRLSLPTDRAHLLAQPEHALIASRWDDYARALLPLALSAGAQLELGRDLERFVSARRQAIAECAAARSGTVASDAMLRVVDGLAFVAGMYRALLAPESEPVAVARLADIVVALASGEPHGPRAADTASAA
ncbi:MAG TPA: hypothetical protein VLV16_03205 [Gemmatimonadales bacterium]|nr:hypothetical protein [Gemmatimonadales bacterium]